MRKKLIELAKEAREYAYAPYSNFKVGAAVLTSNGKTFTGANIENSSYGATVCAERVAVFNAVSAGEKEIVELAVVADTKELSMPCGICRQVLVEFSKDLKIYVANLDGKFIEKTLEDLLPMAFTRENLKGVKRNI